METDKRGKWVGVAVLAAAVAGGGLYLKRPRQTPPSEPALPATPVPAPLSPGAPPEEPRPSPPPPPVSLGESDAYLRAQAKDVGARLLDWFKTDNLIRRFVAATAIVADGGSPREALSFMKPEGKFSAQKGRRKGELFLDARSYSRYDLAAGVVDSVNAQAAAKLYQRLEPLFQQAYDELGSPKRDFRGILIHAINVLLAVPRIAAPVPLKAKVVSYAMADERLESLTAAQKHLLRMGPKNAAKVQDKLREFALALGVPETRLATPEAYPPEMILRKKGF